MDYLEARKAKRRKQEHEGGGKGVGDGAAAGSGAGDHTGGISSASFLKLKAQLSQRQARETEPSTFASKHNAAATDPFAALETRKNAKYSPLRADLRTQPALGEASPSSSLKSKRKQAATTTLSQWSKTPSAQLERDRRVALEKKAKLYEQLKKGLSGGLRPEDLDEGGQFQGMIDWEKKLEQDDSGDDDDDDESDSASAMAAEDEEQIEYTDDLGRTRLLPRSQVPMEYLMQLKREADSAATDDSTTLYGPQMHFPVFQPETREMPPAPPTHFDASHEIRNRGAGFFKFDQDEDTRRKQMEELASERKETERMREKRPNVEAQDHASRLAPASDELTVGERRLRERHKFVEVKKAEIKRKTRGSEGIEGIGGKESDTAPVDAFLKGVAEDWLKQQQQQVKNN